MTSKKRNIQNDTRQGALFDALFFEDDIQQETEASKGPMPDIDIVIPEK